MDPNEPRIYNFKKEVSPGIRKRFHKKMEGLAVKFRKRERKEFDYQFEKEYYLLDLMDVMPEIDEYLKKETQEAPTEHMIAYAKHPWPYNEMKSQDRYRLSKIRVIVEEYLQYRQTNSNNPNGWVRTISEANSKKIPICSICRLDFANNDNNSPLKLRCGHIFHLKCMVDYFCQVERKDSCPICRKSAKLIETDTVFFSYSDQ